MTEIEALEEQLAASEHEVFRLDTAVSLAQDKSYRVRAEADEALRRARSERESLNRQLAGARARERARAEQKVRELNTRALEPLVRQFNETSFRLRGCLEKILAARDGDAFTCDTEYRRELLDRVAFITLEHTRFYLSFRLVPEAPRPVVGDEG